jgi:hypothetical protein
MSFGVNDVPAGEIALPSAAYDHSVAGTICGTSSRCTRWVSVALL